MQSGKARPRALETIYHPHPHPHHPHPHHFDLTSVEEPPVSCCEPDGYGELARTAVDDLAKALGLDETPTPVFYDLGSGAGKVVAHMALAGYAAKAVGVEVNDGRHVAALALRAAALASKGADVDLRNEDMFDVDLAEATTLYVNQACFPAEVRDRLHAKILREAANLEYVVAAPPIPALEAAGLFVVDQPVLHLPMELYTYATPLTIYRRADRTA